MWGKVPPRRPIFNLNSWKCLELWHMILTMASSNTEQIPINKLIVLGSQVVHEILYFDWNSNVNLSTKGDSNFVFLLSSLKTNFHDKCSCKWWGRMTQGGGEVRQMLTIAVWEPLNLADILCAPCICKLWDIFSFCWHSLPPLGRMWHISHLTPFLSPSTPPLALISSALAAVRNKVPPISSPS